MLEGGRIQDHLYNNIQNYYCTILFIGYCAKGTLGYRLLRGDPIVHIKDRELAVYATIKKTDVLSAHGDHEDLMNVGPATRQKQGSGIIFLVHGEEYKYAGFVQLDWKKEGYVVYYSGKGS